MKTTLISRFVTTLPLIVAAVLGTTALRAESPRCPLQNVSLNGEYVLRSTGTAGGAPFASVGRISYDGAGNFELTGTASVNGTVLRGLAGTGTYTVNRDCSGTQTYGTGPEPRTSIF